MQYIADLHVHSKYSRAVSRDMVLPVMAKWAVKKGIDILTTADWTHPLWFREIQANLEEASEGLFRLKGERETLFILTTEISSIYSEGGQVRRIHNLIFSPSLEICEKISKELIARHCNLHSDGRPIIGLSSKQLLELIMSVDKDTLLVPCHAWTPWFSLYGSKSGFDSIEECFGEYSKFIYGIETGLSSDPEMNWRIKELENRSIISNSDSHSPAKMGREATVFSAKNSKQEITYDDIIGAIKQDPASKLQIRYTIEFYPEEGKYHYTGHRNCGVVQDPRETKTKGNICPVCKRPLTVGVMHRVEELAQQTQNDEFHILTQVDKNGVKWYGDPLKKHPPYVKLVPLLEILAESLSSTVASIKVQEEFNHLCQKFGSEVKVLLKTPVEDIEKESNPRIAEGIKNVRSGDIIVDPGFDGEYGKVHIWNNQMSNSKSQIKMNDPKETTSIFDTVKEDESQLSLDL